MFNRFASSTNTANSAFGIGGASNSPFGSFGNVSAAAPPPGAPSAPYSVTNEVENGITIKLLSISAMPAYRHLSPEEIRVEDYLKGRKGPSAFPGAKPIGSSFSSPFSSASTATTHPLQQPTSSGFGSFNSGFGGQSSTVNPSSTFGGFSGNTSFAPQSGSVFSSTPNSSFGSSSFNTPLAPSQVPNSLFGAPLPSQQQQQSSAFGGSSSPAPFGTSSTNTLFGASKPSAPSFGGSFPGSSSSPSSAFGGQTTGAFGTTPSSMPSGSSGFLNPQSQTSAFGGQTSLFPSSSAGSSSLFPSSGAATNAGFGGFNSTAQPPQQQQAPSTGFFGSSSPANPLQSGGLFSASSAPPTAANTSFFGQSQSQAQPQQPQSTSLFGTPSTASTTNANSSSLFRPTTASTGSSFNFGASATTPLPPATSTGGSLFGGVSSSTPSSTIGGGLASSSLFNRPTNSLINNNNTITSSTTPLTTNTTSSMFPSTSSLFGGQSQPQQPQQNQFSQLSQLSAPSNSQFSLNQPSQPQSSNFPNVAAGSLSLAPPLPPIFTKTEPSTTTSSSAVKQAPSGPPKSPVKFTPRTSFRIKPRESYNLTAPIPLNFGIDSAANMNSNTTTATLIPRKLAGVTPNIKKLVIPDFNDSSFEEPSIVKNNENKSGQTNFNSSASPDNQNILTSSLSFGQQYTFPPVKILKSLSPLELKTVKNFVVGQKGVGEIRFLVPVDLSAVDLDAIFGHLVEFCEGEAVLYPDPNIPKPGPGEGLNLPAQVRLERIWTLSRASRDPIIDPQNEKVILFTQKLRETEGTNFVSYDPANGTWIFTVDHF